MASLGVQEASSSTSHCAYQVFLSFRGIDTRKTIAAHLYTALMQAGIHTFRDDDEIERGEKIKSELEKGIQQSRASIIVFSKNYASSRWCLDELALILEQKRTSRLVVLPVFYDVDPTNVRRQSGTIGEAFAKYEKELETETNYDRKNVLLENIKRWRTALKDSADLSGMALKSNGDEAEFVQKVVNLIRNKLSRKVLDVAPHLVGMHSRTRDINLWIQDDSIGASILLISGMGGIGKTTIAKFVFNQNFENFAGASFISNIRERSKEPEGVINLQKQILSDIFKRKNEKIYNVDEGINKIRDAIGCKRVLIVLDDVDDIEQLNALFKMQDRVFPGSKIIVTTRNDCLLKSNEVYEMHKVEKLSNADSIDLFSYHAFPQVHPTKSYMEYTEKIVAHCGGLPLALQVIGSSLSGKKLDVWASQLRKLQSNPDDRIVEKLKISFNSLPDDDVKNIFLHIACFFVGEDKDWTVKVLDSCDFHALVGIEHLLDRCLLEIDYSKKLIMHQLIQDMGRDIVQKESPEPEERSRLWHSHGCFRVLTEKTGTRAIKALAFGMQMSTKDKPVQSVSCQDNAKRRRFEEQVNWFSSLKRRALNLVSGHVRSNTGKYSNDIDIDTEAFTRMHQLKFLKLIHVKLSGSYREFPKRIRWLCWHGCNLEFIPNDLSLQSLVCLDMQYSDLKQVWKGSELFPALKILNLSHSQWLAKSPDFSGLPNLESLILKGCTQLVNLCESIGYVEGLALLDLKDCKRIRKLPRNISRLIFLEEMIISGCSSLVEFPMGLGNMKSLKVFKADETGMNALLSPSKDIQTWASFPRFLGELSLRDCNLSNDSFPGDFSHLTLLKKLDLSKNLVRSLPNCCQTLGRLEILWLDGCPLLQSVLGLPRTVKYLLGEAYKGFEQGEVHSTWNNTVRISTFGCPKLVEIEGCFKLIPIKNVDRRIIRSLGLLDLKPTLSAIGEFDVLNEIKVRFEYGVFSTWFEGGEVPECFSFRNENSSSITFAVPLVPNNHKIQGLSVGWVYATDPDLTENYHSWITPILRISNQTRGLSWSYNPTTLEVTYNTDKIVWLSYWKLGTLLACGDKVIVTIEAGELKVKQLGVKVVYDEHDDEDNHTDMKQVLTDQLQSNIYLSWTEQTLLELSDFHKAGTSYYFGEEEAGDNDTSMVKRFVDWRGTYYDDSHCNESENDDSLDWREDLVDDGEELQLGLVEDQTRPDFL